MRSASQAIEHARRVSPAPRICICAFCIHSSTIGRNKDTPQIQEGPSVKPLMPA